MGTERRADRPALNRETLEQEYLAHGKSALDIAQELGFSAPYVNDRLHAVGIPVRSRREARLLALEQGKIHGQRPIRFKKCFFRAWTPEMAYVLGVIATDGSLSAAVVQARTGYRSAPYVSLTQKEPELLEKVLTLMECDAPIRFTGARGVAGPVHSFQIAGEGLFADLIALGLTPRKSRTLSFPDVPEACLRHFVRGCWDGDGSFYVSGKALCASIVSGSRRFIEGLVARLVAAGFSRRTIYRHASSPGREAFMIRLRGEEALRFCEFLYEDVPSPQYLSRKFEVFRRFRTRRGAETGSRPTAS